MPPNAPAAITTAKAEIPPIPADVWILFTARTMSLVGNYLQYIALPLWVLAFTGSATATGLTFAIEILPIVFLAPWAGYFVDRFDRRTVLIVADLLSAVAVGALLLAVSWQQLPLVYAALMAIRVFDVFSMPAVSAIINSRVPKSALNRAVATSEALFGAVVTISPIAGSLLFGRFGIEVLLVANLISFVASSATTSLLPPNPGSKDLTSVRTALRKAAGIVTRDRRLLSIALAEISYFLCSGGITLLALLIAERAIGPDLTGVYLGGIGLGWLICSLFIVRRYGGQPNTLLWIGLLGCTLVGLVLWKVIALNPVACFAGGVLAGSMNVLVISAITIIYSRRVPPEAVGRVFAGRRAAINLALVLSYLILPGLAGMLSPGATAMLAGVVTTLTCGAMLLCAVGKQNPYTADAAAEQS